MTLPRFDATQRAKFVFIGVSTDGSSIMRIFPKWSDILGLNCDIVGIDLPLRAPAESYRAIVKDIALDPTVKGALVTAHKIDLLAACRDLFDELDDDALTCDEISCIAKRDGRLLGYAVDPASSALAMDQFVPRGHWMGDRHVLCLGGGGAAIAISVCMAKRCLDGDYPSRFVLSDILPERLELMRRIHAKLDSPIQFEYHLTTCARDNNDMLCALPAGSLVINATGLGKDRPGSPLTYGVDFPQSGLIWELNYRGERDFMRGAAAQASPRNLIIEDGWKYFLHGWTQAIAKVFEIDLDKSTFERLDEAAAPYRQA